MVDLPLVPLLELQPEMKLEITAKAAGSPDILAIAQLQASMKDALQGLARAFNQIEIQTERMNQLTLEIKAREQLEALKNELAAQIKHQKEELDALKESLETRIKEVVTNHIKSQLYDMIKESLATVIEEKVREELSRQIPDHLKQTGQDHQRQILQTKTNLHNSEARRYNASLESASLTAPLRPLLRPVPTPEQSPYPILVTSATGSGPNSAIPFSSFPHAPAPTPVRRTRSNIPSAISRSQSLQPIPSTPAASALFPRDLKSLFSLGPDATRALLREYGLQSTMSSPVVEDIKLKVFKPASEPHSPVQVIQAKAPRSLSPIPGEAESDEDVKAHVEDMNTFMTHIGVPFLMVPPPKAKETNADRRRKLAPLVINTSCLR
ncbi:hypothetical protein MD484_g6012, partial [Candolleomyces efflorescens]